MGRHRGGKPREPLLHPDAVRLFAEADYPPAVKQTILLALRGGRPGKQVCLACGKAAQHCQFWLPPALLQAVPDPREHPAVYWLCATHHGQLADAEIVALLVRRGRTAATVPQRRWSSVGCAGDTSRSYREERCRRVMPIASRRGGRALACGLSPRAWPPQPPPASASG
jgi:hypothetical protein